MKVTTVSEALTLKPGISIDCIAGTVQQVWDRKTGTSQYGPWAIQNIQITDGSHKIKVKLTNIGELTKDWVGHKLYVIAGIGRKNQSIGLKSDVDTYNGVTSVIVSANQNCRLDGNPPGGTEAQPDAQPEAPPDTDPVPHDRRWPDQEPGNEGQEEQGPPPQRTASAPAARPVSAPIPGPAATKASTGDSAKAWETVDSGFKKLVRLQWRSLQHAHKVAREMDRAGTSISREHVEKIAQFMAIEVCRQGGLINIPDCDPPLN